METESELNIVNKSIELIVASISRLSRQVKLNESRLWRQDKYSELLEQNNIHNKQQATLLFHQAVDYILLEQYAQRVEDSIVECFNEFKTPESLKLKQVMQSNQNSLLIEEYSRTAARQLTLIERFIDLVSMPYGILMKQTLQLRKEFTMDLHDVGKSTLNDLISNHGQDVAMKGLGKISTQLCNKFIVGLTTVIGGINLAGIAGGLAVGKLFEIASGRLSERKILDRLKLQIIEYQKNIQFLNERYKLCRKLLKEYIQCKSTEDNKLIRQQYLTIMKEIFYFEYQQTFIIKQLDNGWKIVEIQNTLEDFQQLRLD